VDRPRIVALVSTFDEDEIIVSCLSSAKMLDGIIVFDGTTSSDKVTEHRNRYVVEGDFGEAFRRKFPYLNWEGIDLVYVSGSWKSDAHKRTEMMDFAKHAQGHEDWALWLDGDEVLLWGQYLHDHCTRADHVTGTGGTTLKIVEYDGSVAECFGKLIKLDAVKRYIMSSYEIELSNGMTVALPNVPLCTAGGLPIGNITSPDDPLLAKNRPPLQGEPHLLHRHGLRSPEREALRMHDTEGESFSDLVKSAGLEGVDTITQTRRDGNGT
jgi:hypothetical protein